MTRRLKVLTLFTYLALSFSASIAQNNQNDTAFAKQQPDSLKLPFAISNEKMLSDEDLEHKKEGLYFTGVPDISSDPVNGFGAGLEGSMYINGKRSDPFFKYTPYRMKMDVAVFVTTKLQREVAFKFDIPYIFNSKWRLRVEASYEVNPNNLYFGKDENTLKPLTNPNNPQQTFRTFKDYNDNLSYVRKGNTGEAPLVTDIFYNTYRKDEYILNVSGERSYWDSKLRLLAGYEFAVLNISTFDGKSYKNALDTASNQTVEMPNGMSKLQTDNAAGNFYGVGKSHISFLQLGIVYDTRDLETDPSSGVFAEITNELSIKGVASSFSINKTFVHVKFYQQLFPKVFKKFVLAFRFGMGYTALNAPFFEYQDEWSSEGSIEGLGGAHTLRGYKQSRFLARVMNFANLELRLRFWQTKLLKQHLAFSAVPFCDAGGVWNDFNTLTRFQNYRVSPGLGLRIAWNVNTILRFDYAVSKEDNQFFFSLGQSF